MPSQASGLAPKPNKTTGRKVKKPKIVKAAEGAGHAVVKAIHSLNPFD